MALVERQRKVEAEGGKEEEWEDEELEQLGGMAAQGSVASAPLSFCPDGTCHSVWPGTDVGYRLRRAAGTDDSVWVWPMLRGWY